MTTRHKDLLVYIYRIGEIEGISLWSYVGFCLEQGPFGIFSLVLLSTSAPTSF